MKPMLAKPFAAKWVKPNGFIQPKLDGCLHRTSKVMTNKGPISIGDIVDQKLELDVLSYNQNEDKFEYKPIVNWFDNGKSSYKDWVEIHPEYGPMLKCTANHEILTNEGWIEAGALDSSQHTIMLGSVDYLPKANKKYTFGKFKVRKARNHTGEIKKYDIEVADNHNYIANNILVHNCRLIWTGEEAMSRRGKPILGVPALVEQIKSFFPGIPLDGELYFHGEEFQSLVGSIRRSKNIDENFNIGYHVYDIPIEGVPFSERIKMLKEKVELANHLGADRIHLVETIQAPDSLDANELNIYEAQGYEGTMWRAADSLYKIGKRSSDLLKIKTFLEEEFEVVGVTELMRHEKLIVEAGTPGAHEYADGTWYKNGDATPGSTCGSIVCVTPEGKEFEIGTGMDDATRLAYWKNPPIGKLLTVKFQEYSMDKIPRFPVHKAIRDYE